MIVCALSLASLALAAPVRDRDLDAWQRAADALANRDLLSAMATLDALAKAGGALAPEAALALGITCSRWELYEPCPVGPGAFEQLGTLAGQQPRGPLRQHALAWLATVALGSPEPVPPEERLREAAARFGLSDLPALWLLLDDAQIRSSAILERDALAAVATDPLWLRDDTLPELVLRLRDDRHAIGASPIDEPLVSSLEERLSIGGSWWDVPRPEFYATIALSIASERAMAEFLAIRADGYDQEAFTYALRWLEQAPDEAPRSWARYVTGDEAFFRDPDDGYRAIVAYRRFTAHEVNVDQWLYSDEILLNPTTEALRDEVIALLAPIPTSSDKADVIEQIPPHFLAWIARWELRRARQSSAVRWARLALEADPESPEMTALQSQFDATELEAEALLLWRHGIEPDDIDTARASLVYATPGADLTGSLHHLALWAEAGGRAPRSARLPSRAA